MRIGIDARVMTLKASGIGRYTLEMIKSIASLPEAGDHEFILYPGRMTEILRLPDNWTYSTRKISSRGILRSPLFSLIAEHDGLDVFYSTDYLGPVLPMPCRTVITVHDLIPIIYPGIIKGFQHRLVGNYLLPHAIRHASVVVSVSEATKKDILDYIQIPEGKVTVVYEGKNPSFYPRLADNLTVRETRSYYGVGDCPYILCLSVCDPKKNASASIKAFAEMIRRLECECLLFMAGSAEKGERELERMAGELKVRDRVIFAGFIPDEQLPILMSGARALCFPSLYEGFGLPVLEAMACGCPVITSNISSLPEVAGDAALQVDPNDIQQLSRAMEKLLTDDTLYDDLKARGISRAKRFSWENAASQLLDILIATDT